MEKNTDNELEAGVLKSRAPPKNTQYIPYYNIVVSISCSMLFSMRFFIIPISLGL